MKYVCIGDSLTFGYGVNPDRCWVRRFGELTGTRTVNLGVNGDTTAYILQRTKAYIRQGMVEKGDVVIIMGGENDVLMYGASHFDVENIVGACVCVQDCGARPVVMIQPGFVPSRYAFYGDMDPDRLNRNHDEYADMLVRKCSEQGINAVDLRPLIGKRPELYIDGVHLKPEGHEMIAQNLKSVL